MSTTQVPAISFRLLISVSCPAPRRLFRSVLKLGHESLAGPRQRPPRALRQRRPRPRQLVSLRGHFTHSTFFSVSTDMFLAYLTAMQHIFNEGKVGHKVALSINSCRYEQHSIEHNLTWQQIHQSCQAREGEADRSRRCSEGTDADRLCGESVGQ